MTYPHPQTRSQAPGVVSTISESAAKRGHPPRHVQPRHPRQPRRASRGAAPKNAARSDAKIAVLTPALSMFVCHCCGGNAGLAAPGSLCSDCRSVIALLKAEERAGETVNGRSRRELAADYLARQP